MLYSCAMPDPTDTVMSSWRREDIVAVARGTDFSVNEGDACSGLRE